MNNSEKERFNNRVCVGQVRISADVYINSGMSESAAEVMHSKMNLISMKFLSLYSKEPRLSVRLMDFRYSIIPGVFTFTGMKKLNSFLKAGSPIHLIRMDGYPENLTHYACPPLRPKK